MASTSPAHDDTITLKVTIPRDMLPLLEAFAEQHGLPAPVVDPQDPALSKAWDDVDAFLQGTVDSLEAEQTRELAGSLLEKSTRSRRYD